ncbi:MAG: translocation/assembly module TamB domain-containing protein, partial [Geminicoccaceae bacterium]|nr:translocation/assembly module TamB domain-containing protein [Geminicoccaceae bacterium]
ADAEGAQPSQGRLQLDVALPRIEASLASRYRFDGTTLALEDTSLTGPGLEVAGQATTELASGLTTGRFEGQVAELAELEALIPVPLRGQVDLDLDLKEQAGGQAVALAVEAGEVSGPFGALQQATLAADLRDVLAEPKLDARLRLDGFRQEATRVDLLTVRASGGLEELAIDLSVEGEATATFDLEGRTVVALGDAIRVRLERLEGTVAEQPLRLAEPATVALEQQTIELSALDLRYAGGRLRADATIGPGPVSGEIRLDGLPLSNLQSLGLPPLAGTLQAAVDLAGDAADPNLDLALRIPDLRSPDPSLGDVPPLDLALDAALRSQRLNAELRASGLTEAPITAEVALPVLANLETFAFEAPPSGELEGAVQADVRLRRIADLLVLDGQRLEGRLQARLDLGGTVGEPAANGRITLDNGLYENGATGTVLRDITLRAEASDERLALRELTATDGGNGRVSGSGAVEFDADRNFPLIAEINLRDAKLVRRDDVEVTLGGRVGVEGDLQRSLVGGRIVVERAEVSLPDPSGAPDVAVLDVEEVGQGFGAEDDAAAAEEADPRVVELDLTIVVPERFYVRGRGLESEWQGRLQVEGTLDQPALVGNLEIKRGTFDFLDRRFDLQDGAIGFTGGLPPVPEIDISAVAEADDITAIVRATGTPEDLEIRLTSEPEMPEDEVLSRLLFDRDLSEISPTEAASLALAVNRLRGGGGGLDILGRARKALGVDTLDVGGAAGEESVKAGKYLSDDVYVEVEQGRAQNGGRARVELEVLPNVSIEADVGQDSRSGVGVKWQYDF